MVIEIRCRCVFFFFNDTATTEIYTLSLHDALSDLLVSFNQLAVTAGILVAYLANFALKDVGENWRWMLGIAAIDRKSTRLNSSHVEISYAVFCLKKKKYRCSSTRTISYYTV